MGPPVGEKTHPAKKVDEGLRVQRVREGFSEVRGGLGLEKCVRFGCTILWEGQKRGGWGAWLLEGEKVMLTTGSWAACGLGALQGKDKVRSGLWKSLWLQSEGVGGWGAGSET